MKRFRMPALVILTTGLLFNTARAATENTATESTATESTATESTATESTATNSVYASDVINIRAEHLSPDYWIKADAGGQTPIMSSSAIDKFNQDAFAADKNLINLDKFPTQLSRAELRLAIEAISRPPTGKRVFANGQPVTKADYQAYQLLLNLPTIADSNRVQYGLVVQRTNMRTFPTLDRIFKHQPSDLDRFQETALFPADVVLVLHQSLDRQWVFAQSYNYAAWVQKKHIAIGSRAEVFDYKNAENFLVISGDKVRTNYNPRIPALSELQLDMGIRLPLAAEPRQHNIHGQNPYASHTVRMPLRTDAGALVIETALIARSRDVSLGYLRYSSRTIIHQAFKFLGERYGWGHIYNGRDCSGFTAEVYKSMGILLPRNSSQQARTAGGITIRFQPDSSLKDKLAALKTLSVGDLIFIPGHVMMFIGNSAGKPYVIHDVTNINYYAASGEYYSNILNGVSVTPLLPLHRSPTKSYVDSIYSIKKLK